MRIKVFGPFGLARNLDEKGWLDIEEGATLGQAIHKIGLPTTFARIVRVALNGQAQPMDTVLKDGDVISFFALIYGG